MKKERKLGDPYANIRRDNPPPDFAFRSKVIYNRKPRKHVKVLIQKELEQYFEEEEEKNEFI